MLAEVRLALSSPVEDSELTDSVPVLVAGTLGACMSDGIESNETTEGELEDAGDMAGALAPQEIMCGAIGIKLSRIEWRRALT